MVLEMPPKVMFGKSPPIFTKIMLWLLLCRPSKIIGYYCPLTKTIWVNSTLSEKEQLRTLLHEYGHHSLGLDRRNTAIFALLIFSPSITSLMFGFYGSATISQVVGGISIVWTFLCLWFVSPFLKRHGERQADEFMCRAMKLHNSGD